VAHPRRRLPSLETDIVHAKIRESLAKGAAMPDALWGTFSVSDHLRKRAFVADVLLYDKLVIPYPPDDEQRTRWRKQRWNPGRLERKLEILDKAGLVQLAPWSEWKHELFRRRMRTAERVGAENDLVRDARSQSELDEQVAMWTTREILCDDVHGIGSAEDVAYIKKLPGDYVEAVAAYTSYVALKSDIEINPNQPAAIASAEERSTEAEPTPQLAGIFGWEIFVPNDPRLDDNELLTKAVKLAKRDELREARLSFHDWRRKQVERGVADKDALADLERRLTAYREATRRTTLRKWSVNAFTLVGIGASAAASFVFPPAAAAAPFIAAGRFGADQWLPNRPPGKESQAVAMFYDARRHFGWKPPRAGGSRQ
jgi:hypothetical protein